MGRGRADMAGENDKTVSAAILAIGDELLSGRTMDKNIGYIARYMTEIGVDVREARIVADEEERIVAALNELRSSYDYVFTTGGIGPTHDDITADAVAKAFGVSISHHPQALAILKERYEKLRGLELNEARLRMARIPDGGGLIENTVSGAPGIHIGNVFVMAGVPAIMQAMLDKVAPLLKTGRRMLSRTLKLSVAEGDIAAILEAVQKQYSGLSIGSYPFYNEQVFGTNVVLRARDEKLLDEAEAALREALGALAGNG